MSSATGVSFSIACADRMKQYGRVDRGLVYEFLAKTLTGDECAKLWAEFKETSKYDMLIDYITYEYPDIWFRFKAWKAVHNVVV